jgi:hypothetical protein
MNFAGSGIHVHDKKLVVFITLRLTKTDFHNKNTNIFMITEA